ncbi:MAG: hypothetical protein GKS07_07145 [Nitrosopumilus sp.]|nr:MAG: hypothetical protein GKS07_07145 [Nitrosopumilus sp.]
MNSEDWTKPANLIAITGIIVSVILTVSAYYLSSEEPEPLPTGKMPSERPLFVDKIHTDIDNLLSKQISSDVDILLEFTKNENIQSPFTLDDMKNNNIVFCKDTQNNLKCDSLDDLRFNKLIFSPYTLIFISPQEANTNSGIVSIESCVIEWISIDSHDVVTIENKWDDRQWCTHSDAISMTDQYIPRGKSQINVNSLSMKYETAGGIDAGLVIAYHFEHLIEDYVMKSQIDTFNVILLDASNCVSGAVSKMNGKTTEHLDSKLYRLTGDVEKDMMVIKEWTSTDDIEKTNCPSDPYTLDPKNEISLNVKENSDDASSKLDGNYYVYEITTIRAKDIGNQSGDVNMFKDWKLLVSVR